MKQTEEWYIVLSARFLLRLLLLVITVSRFSHLIAFVLHLVPGVYRPPLLDYPQGDAPTHYPRALAGQNAQPRTHPSFSAHLWHPLPPYPSAPKYLRFQNDNRT